MVAEEILDDLLAESVAMLGSTFKLSRMFSLGDRIIRSEPPRGCETQRIAIAGSTTLDYAARGIACAVAAEAVWPVLHQAPFGAWVQHLIDPASALHAFAPDLVVLMPDWRDQVEALPLSSSRAEVAAHVEQRAALFERAWAALLARPGTRIIQHVLPAPPDAPRGMADRLLPASAQNQVRMLNDQLFERGAGRVTWLETDRLAALHGRRRWAPPRLHFDAKLEFDPRYMDAYLAAFGGAWRAACGRMKKVLAIDLDNTLWGGVIGDDGVDGIVLGQGTPEGEAFQSWQRHIKSLVQRGVILAACTKNAPEIAETGLLHPFSELRRTDFSAFAASWSDKAGGLRTIAQALNVGIDSIVLVDDNPAECALVRQMLPEVQTVCLGDDPAAFIEILEDRHLFDAQTITAEDTARAGAYAARAAAAAAMSGATNLDSYLAGIGMVGQAGACTEEDVARVAQLEMKTNQFNTMTRRFSEAEIRAFMARDDALVLTFRLADRFGNHGLVSTLVATRSGDALRIESWLMSCRVFSRTVEQFIMRHVVDAARALGAGTIVGLYAPTAKNGVVGDLWSRLGFVAAGDGWERAVADGDADLTTFIAAGP